MASQSLYRKWRSQTFSDMVGQEQIIVTLKNALIGGTLSHAYLFTGPRGTGKTSTARLLAKTINCPNTRNGEPCNQCEQCKEITAGNSFNVIEIDAASNRGIDSIRELREKVMMPPSTGKYKVYILDEAHMLTTEAFNALLKTLEEPPAHAVFVMATTDVHKMLPTVLSRCQRFDFKRFTTRQIVAHLNFVAAQEHVKLERGAAELIARAAAGGMRDALSLLDQAIAYAGQEITLTQVQAMLGVADPRAIQHFIFHIANLDSSAGLHLIHELTEAGADLRQLNAQIAEYWRAMMLAKAGADIAAILDDTEDEVKEIVEVAQHFALDELMACARIFAQNELMQKGQGTPQLGLELALLACIEQHRRPQAAQAMSSSPSATPPVQLRPAPSRPAIPPPVVLRSQAPASPETPAPPPVTVQPPQPPVPSPVSVHEEAADDLPDWETLRYEEEDEEFVPAPVIVAAPIVAAIHVKGDQELVAVEEPASQNSDNAPVLTIQQVKEKWEYVKRRVKTKKDGAKIAAVLNGYTIVDVEGTSEPPVVVIRANAPFHYSSIQKDVHYEAIEWAFKVELGRDCRVRLLPPGSGAILPPPPSPTRDAGNRSANSALSLGLQSPAYREPAAPLSPVAPQAKPQAQAKELPKQEPYAPSSVSETRAPPLANSKAVRENTSKISSDVAKASGTRQEVVKKKAEGDPVVQEVVRIFRADIKEFHLK